MQHWLTGLGLSILLAIAICKYLIQPLFLSPLQSIPLAHPLCGISDLYFRYLARQERELDVLLAAHKRHGPIVRSAPNEVSIVSLEGLRHVYTSCAKTDFYYVFANYHTPNMVSMLDHKSHSVQKRILSGVYSKSHLQHSEDLAKMSKAVICDRLLPLLEHLATQGRPANVYRLMQFVGLDFQTAFQFGLDRSTKLVEYHGHEGVHYTTKKSSEPYDANDSRDHDLLPEDEIIEMCKATLSSISTGDALTTADTTATSPIVFEKLHSALLAQNYKGPNTNNKVLLRTASELRDHIIAAQETTAITLTYTLHELSRHPHLQEQLRTELTPLPPFPTPSSLDSLPLLHAVLIETLRLHVPTPARQPRIIGPDGLILHGHHLPPGTIISSNAYCLHRNKDVFPDPLTWRPERWLGEPKEVEEMRKWFWAFSSGGRMCLGSNFAMMILKATLASIYGRFETEVVDDGGVEQGKTFIAKPKGERLILLFRKIGRGERDEAKVRYRKE
ncbi:cytochrome P450 monooxygenase-like protein [Dothistroma septosporum NZE10]|uniref:Cytochrome P450 monooxygenase-like protein n=1 Tax=Dothistroma septosporum (strain NZE10 / CBS 128990) TaxID=675120 RepID=M2YJL0_DOTSN|nr:cytochrome P450 monooxygenase-like protein [Dothistroma septosporum NZE10]